MLIIDNSSFEWFDFNSRVEDCIQLSWKIQKFQLEVPEFLENKHMKNK